MTLDVFAILAAGFVGFVSALAVQWLVLLHRRRRIARVSRDMIASACRHNLRALDNMESSIAKTLSSKLPATIQATLRPSGAVYERLISPEVIDCLTPLEASAMVELVMDLSRAVDAEESVYENFRSSVANPLQPAQVIQNARHNWDQALQVARWNALSLLMMCIHKQDKHVTSANARLAQQTRKTRAAWRSAAYEKSDPKLAVVGLTSHLKGVEDKEFANVQTVTCWRHDWPECAKEVVELSSLIS